MRGILSSAALLALVLGLACLLVIVPAVKAHTSSTVAGVDLNIGFLNEPAYAGQSNGVELTVTAAEGGAEPVASEIDLMVEVTYLATEEQVTLVLDHTESDGEHEHGGLLYTAPFTPSTPGDYRFHVMGTIAGEAADASFDSGPDTFSPVLALETFPPVNSAREVQNVALANQTAITELEDSIANIRIGMWATVAGLGVLIVSTGIATVAFLMYQRRLTQTEQQG